MNINEKKESIANTLSSNWKDTKIFLDNKQNLTNLLKTFYFSDIKEIFLEGKNRGIVKKAQEKIFFNILTRMKLKIPLTITEFRQIIPFYVSLMNQILAEENKDIESEDVDEKLEEDITISKEDEEIMNILF